MNNYVCGFLFIGQDVVLIRKQRPDWQIGLLNGVGGKIEDGETELEAMCREFEEEAGAQVDNWIKFANFTDYRNYNVAFFYALGCDCPSDICTQTDEDIEIINLDTLRARKTISNLQWLIPMALSLRDVKKTLDITEMLS